MVFFLFTKIVSVYDRTKNWTNTKNICTVFNNYQHGYYSSETNVAVVFSSNCYCILTFSFATFNYTRIFNIFAAPSSNSIMGTSNTFDGFAFVNGSNALFFTVPPYCSGNKIFNDTSGLCVVCDTYCA